MPFAVGDKVVYPHHGAAIIESKEKRVFEEKKTDYFVLRITYGDLKVSIPVDNSGGTDINVQASTKTR